LFFVTSQREDAAHLRDGHVDHAAERLDPPPKLAERILRAGGNGNEQHGDDNQWEHKTLHG
jgi:hypothetical protein